MCDNPLSVHSLVTELAISLHGNSCLAASTRLNSQHLLRVKHLVFMCNHGLHSSFLGPVCCLVARFATHIAVTRESATLILLQPTGTTLALKSQVFLADALQLLPASTLALALTLLVSRFGLVPLGLLD